MISTASRDSTHYRQARALGEALARRGATVRCGGYDGVMEAVASGARAGGGKVVGCTLAWFREDRNPNSQLTEISEADDLAGGSVGAGAATVAIAVVAGS